MSTEPLSLFSRIAVFRALPESALQQLADAASRREVKTGEVLLAQGRMLVDGVYVIGAGAIELSDQRDGRPQLVETLQSGTLFGGIAVLLNGGLSLRTARVVEDGYCWIIPGKIFLEFCRDYPALHRHFSDLLEERMQDSAYAEMFAVQRAFGFLQTIPPFSFLPEAELRQIAGEVRLQIYPADTVVCAQGLTLIDELYIVKHGAALRYFEGEQPQAGGAPMGEGGLFGGISMLINDSVSLRTLRTIEDSGIYLWRKQRFLEVCDRYPQFLDYFTDAFGKRMLDRSYAAIVAKTMQPGEEAQPFLNQPVSMIGTRPLVTCAETATAQQAARLMCEGGSGSIMVKSPAGEIIGIVTDRDLRQRVLAAGRPNDVPVASIMSSPVKTISGQALVFEAVMKMMQDKIKRLGIVDPEGAVTGVVTTTDLLSSQSHSPLFLMQEISMAPGLDLLCRQHRRLPAVIQACIASGAKADHLNRLITALGDAILTAIVEQALAASGPPPCPFAFLVMGSDGRREQTLKTDQDNAILYPDPPAVRTEEYSLYFQMLGQRICTALDTVGYSFCRGGIMAKNPSWCQPMTVWKDYFSSWVRAAEPEDLMSCSIFFDFRCGYGDDGLVEELRQHLRQLLAEWPSFLQYLAFNAHHFKPPIGFFRNFIVESRGEHRDAFDIKKVMVPIVDFARLYGLKEGLSETNTQERLRLLRQQGAIRAELYQEMSQAYSFLMQLRLARQVTAIMVDKTAPDNYLNPKRLSRIEQTMLKEIFSRIDAMQKEIAYGLG